MWLKNTKKDEKFESPSLCEIARDLAKKIAEFKRARGLREHIGVSVELGTMNTIFVDIYCSLNEEGLKIDEEVLKNGGTPDSLVLSLLNSKINEDAVSDMEDNSFSLDGDGEAE